MARIAVFGLGYVGCTTAIGFAELGHSVVGYDISEAKVQSLAMGKVPMFEAGLEESLHRSSKANLISFTLAAEAALHEADFVFLCVPTPMNRDGSADISYVETALTQIQFNLNPKTVIVLKSTLPLGTGLTITRTFTNYENPLVYNPEFLREGTALADFTNPDRIVIGSQTESAARQTADLYKGIAAPILVTGFGEAELIKYASNAFLAVKISFINEIAHLAQVTGISISEVSKGMGLDKRIGDKFLTPGPGWGGSCFPKDSRELVTAAKKHDVKLGVLQAAIGANEEAKERIVDSALGILGGDPRGKKVAILGLTFKAKTDDVRESPALTVINKLNEAGALITAFDPVVDSLPDTQVTIANSAAEACTGAHLLIVMTEWEDFAQLDSLEISGLMASVNVIDTRKILRYPEWQKVSNTYLALGGVG